MKLIRKLMKWRRPKLNPSSSSSSISSHSYWSFSSSFSFPSPTQLANTAAREESAKKEEKRVQTDMPMLQPAPLAWPSSCSSNHLEWELQLAFRKFDADGDGLISPAEVQLLLQCMGDDVSEEDASLMIKEADKNGDGFVDLQEFINLMMASTTKPPPPFPPHGGDITHIRKAFGQEEERRKAEDEEEQELLRAFRLFDRDGNGLISPEELQQMLWNLREKEASFEQCCQIINAVDRNQDGAVDFEEFKAMMVPLSCQNSNASA